MTETNNILGPYTPDEWWCISTLSKDIKYNKSSLEHSVLEKKKRMLKLFINKEVE